MAKRGINKSIFNKTDKEKSDKHNESSAKQNTGPGRPAKHDEPTKKITVVFGESRFIEINEVCFNILKNHNEKISMTELIRGIIEAVLDSKIELGEATSEQEINEMVTVAIERDRNTNRS